MTYEGHSWAFPLEVTWSGGDDAWVTVWVTLFANGDVSLMATSGETGLYAGVDLRIDDNILSTTFTNMLDAAISEVADWDGEHWKHQTMEVSYRD